MCALALVSQYFFHKKSRFNFAALGALLSRQLRPALALAALTIATLGLRWVLVPPASFHQNGQGPLWISYANKNHYSPLVYGPGYPEALSWLAQGEDPARVVYFSIAALSALCIPLVYFLLRKTLTPPPIAWLVTVLIAAHPLLARLAGSESYIALILGLFMLSAAILAASAQTEVRSLSGAELLSFLLGCLGASCLIAQAARVHPIGWVPAVTLPGLILCLPGAARTKLIRAGLAALIIALIVSLTSLPNMLSVVLGDLGQHRSAQMHFPPDKVIQVALRGLIVVGVVAILFTSVLKSTSWLALGCFIVAFILAFALNPLIVNFPRVHHAYSALYLPILLVSFSAATASLPRRALRFGFGGAALIGYAGVSLYLLPHYITLTTDAQEIRALEGWVKQLPERSSLIYLQRAEKRTIMLPLYHPRRVRGVGISADKPTAPRLGDSSQLFYYRSSLCATQEGAPACEQLEQSLGVNTNASRPLFEAELSPVPSLPWLSWDAESIPVKLFRANKN